MVESMPPNPNSLVPTSAPGDPPPAFHPPPPPPPPPSPSFARPPIRVTTEFDSDSLLFFNKISCKLFDSLAKLKFSFQNGNKGEICEPQLDFISQHLSVHYDVEEQNALIRSSFDVGSRLHFRAAHDVKAQQGEVAMLADLANPGYKFELSSAVPSIGLPKATLKFPLGEVSLEEREDEEVKRLLSINGILKAQLSNGICTAQYKDEDLKLRYCYKDEELSFIPSISLPSNALSFAFKRRFGPSDKLSMALMTGRMSKEPLYSHYLLELYRSQSNLSPVNCDKENYWYNFDSNYWSSVYKHTAGKDYKFKAGYDSEARLGWASLWVGDECGKAKTAPMKMKVQFMLQVPQDDIRSSVFMFRVKKRWDI